MKETEGSFLPLTSRPPSALTQVSLWPQLQEGILLKQPWGRDFEDEARERRFRGESRRTDMAAFHPGETSLCRRLAPGRMQALDIPGPRALPPLATAGVCRP